MLKTAISPSESFLNPNHIAYAIMDETLKRTTNFTHHTAWEIMRDILLTPSVTINEVEVQDVFLIVCNVAKIRSLTGKRLLGRPSHALNVLYTHAEAKAEMRYVSDGKLKHISK